MKTWWFNFPWHVDDIAHLIDLLPTRQTHTQKHKPIAMHTHTPRAFGIRLWILFCISHTIGTSTTKKNIYSELQWFVTFFLTRRCWLLLVFLSSLCSVSVQLFFIFCSFSLQLARSRSRFSTKTLHTQYFVYTRASRHEGPEWIHIQQVYTVVGQV